MHRTLGVALLMGSSAVIGCGREVTPRATGSGGSTSATSGGAGGAGGGAVTGIGSVSAFQMDLPGAPSGANASFRHVTASSGACTTVDHGVCTATVCTSTAAAPTPRVPAGVITVSGGARTVVMSPQADGTYEDQSALALFQGGENIHFDVGGTADVPAHGATLVAPLPVTILTPDVGAPIVVDRAKDFGLTWSGGAPGALLVFGVDVLRYDASNTVVGTVSLSCAFDAATGAATVPSASLAELAPTSSTTSASALFAVLTSQRVSAGSWRTGFTLQRMATSPAGALATPGVTIP